MRDSFMVDLVENLILDVGCGDRGRGTVNVDLCRKTSVDLYERDNINANQTLNFVQATIYNLPFRDNIFQKVLCYHLLEHLKQPKQAIKELIRVSKYEIEIIVPYKWHELIQNMFLPQRRVWARKHHLWNFTRDELKTLFTEMNLFPSISYQYKFLSALHSFKSYYVRNFKQFIIYGLLEAILPPTPGELKVIMNKKVKPRIRAK